MKRAAGSYGGISSSAVKKATGRTWFRCDSGQAISEAVVRARSAAEAQMVKTHSVGTNEAGDTIAEFFITWSFKVKI